MSKNIIPLLFLICFNSYSQVDEFIFPIDTIEKSGFQIYKLRNSSVVLNVSGEQKELFNQVLIWLDENTADLDNLVQTKVEYSMIRMYIPGPIIDETYNSRFELKLNFKKDKIRIEILNFDFWFPSAFGDSGEWFPKYNVGYKDASGNIDDQDAKNMESIKNFLNQGFIPDLKSSIKNQDTW